MSAASALFTEKGITATSMDDIAKAAGYSMRLRKQDMTLSAVGWYSINMKPTGKIVCANAKNKIELPKRIMKKIERCLK